MKTKVIILALAIGASTCLLTAQDGNQRPGGQRPPGREGGPRGPGGPGGPDRQSGFHLLPIPAQEQLNLTAGQQKKVADLEAKVKAKLQKILTPEQLQQFKQMRPPLREGGPGGPGGPGEQGGGPGGPGGMGGQRPVMPIIEALDLNKDGTIDAAEIAKASESLKKLDKNGDGKLTPDEYRPQRLGGPGGAGGFGGGGRPGGQGGPGGEGRPQRPAPEQ